MLTEKLSKLTLVSPFSNVYGLARTLLALGTLGTLLATPTGSLFCPTGGLDSIPHCDGFRAMGVFCLAGSAHLGWARLATIGGLVVVASGWRPRLTCILH